MLITIDVVVVQTRIIAHLDYAHDFLTSFSFWPRGIALGRPRATSENETLVFPVASCPLEASTALTISLTLGEGRAILDWVQSPSLFSLNPPLLHPLL